MKSGTQDVLYSITTPMVFTRDFGSTIQPIRQPVIRHALEKVLVEITRSSSPARGRNEGAVFPAPKINRS